MVGFAAAGNMLPAFTHTSNESGSNRQSHEQLRKSSDRVRFRELQPRRRGAREHLFAGLRDTPEDRQHGSIQGFERIGFEQRDHLTPERRVLAIRQPRVGSGSSIPS